MAIVFSSLQRTRMIFLRIMIVLMLLVLGIIFLVIFSSRGGDSVGIASLNESPYPDSSIPFSIIDSDQVASLDSFSHVDTEFSYSAKNKYGKQVVGTMVAVDKDDAQNMLKKMGLQVVSLEEVAVGRKNPFTPYYLPTDLIAQ